MKGTILQPTYLPWVGYFEMIDASEVFIAFDHVQFVRKSWHHRNRIKSPNGECMLTIPVAKGPRDQRIADAEIATQSADVLAEHWKTIRHNYQKAPHFGRYEAQLAEVFTKPRARLADVTIAIIDRLSTLLGIRTPLRRSSQLDLGVEPVDKTDRVIHLCRAAGITRLYDASGARDFLDAGRFAMAGIGLEFQQYEHPTYHQLFGQFVPYMSVVDLLFNEGGKSLDIIRSGRREPASP